MKLTHGFTLIELVLVMVVVGVLVISVFPNIINIGSQAESSSEVATIGAINDGIVLYRANDAVINSSSGTYPTILDELSTGTTCSTLNRCFSNVLMGGLTDEHWTKTGNNEYTFITRSVTNVYTYNPISGT